ncbi:hypothetical protein [Niabella beijingensis]|uniref:hypothetical protein n=1 Tax=Niabella beijingensis TaxID=2872700 RepID=UPI001CBF2A98|nr:hypothetical protein [Niabella beijingensis]MBZ4190833.1 hypothetical protein [Niabella beijingensis]
MIRSFCRYGWLLLFFCTPVGQLHAERGIPCRGEELRIAVFDVDATPPEGSWLAYDSLVNTWELGLRAKGIVLLGAGEPIVLCAVDWIGIANEGNDAFRETLAAAAGTTRERVAVHTLHQHDAPACDFGAELLLKKEGLKLYGFESSFQRQVLERLTTAIRNALGKARVVTHYGLGKAEVRDVASNRRVLGNDGKVLFTRTSATKDPVARAAPQGLIDPELSLISFWHNDLPLAVLSYYATHPQSYYRTGIANPDIPGVARFFRQLALPDALLLHFNGAGGNITAGKYNDGRHENRYLLAQRLEEGMKQAWEQTVKIPVTAKEIQWKVFPVTLPAKPGLDSIRTLLHTQPAVFIANNASKLVWSQRLKAGRKIDFSCLVIGKARIVHLPGEPFVEYQLAAKKMRTDLFVTVAGYGDYAPGYICTAAAYTEGGYEPGMASAVTADVEQVMLNAIKKLLN